MIFWRHLLDGALPPGRPLGAVVSEAADWPRGLPAPFAILGGANLDPKRGEGRREAIRALLGDSRLQDPAPRWDAPDLTEGDTTVDWPVEGPGRMRVDYVLPSADLILQDAGVLWPIAGAPMAEAVAAASRHRLIWVEVDLP